MQRIRYVRCLKIDLIEVLFCVQTSKLSYTAYFSSAKYGSYAKDFQQLGVEMTNLNRSVFALPATSLIE
jgi:hypothetical protein